MKKNIIFILTTVLFFAASCSEDSKAYKRLAGQWEVLSVEIDGINQTGILADDYWKFDECSKGNTCKLLTFDSANDLVPDTLLYKLTDRAYSISLISPNIDTIDAAVLEIAETRFAFQWRDNSTGVEKIFKYTLAK